MLAPSPQLQQAVACEHWVAQLRSNLAVLVDKCGRLEEANRAAAAPSLTAPYYQELGQKHAELMNSVRPFLMPEKASATDYDFGGRGTRVLVPASLHSGRCSGNKSVFEEGNAEGNHPTSDHQSNIGDGGSKVDTRVRFHDVKTPGFADSPLGALPSSDSRLREGAYGSPDGPLQPSLESPNRHLPSASPRTLATGGDESVGTEAAEEANPETSAQGNSSTEPLLAVDRVEMIRSHAAALASSIGASLGSLLGGRSSRPATSASASASSNAPDSSEKVAESQPAASNEAAISPQKSSLDGQPLAARSSPSRDTHELRHSSSYGKLHLHRGFSPSLNNVAHGNDSSRAISDVWARYHPSRSGGAPSAWWQHSAAFSSEPYAWGTNSNMAVGPMPTWQAALQGPRPLPLPPSSSSRQFPITTPLTSSGIPYIGSSRS